MQNCIQGGVPYGGLVTKFCGPMSKPHTIWHVLFKHYVEMPTMLHDMAHIFGSNYFADPMKKGFVAEVWMQQPLMK